LEREARFLNDSRDWNNDEQIGPGLKFIFPTLRITIDRWHRRSPLIRLAECVDHPLEEVDERVLREKFERAYFDVSDAAAMSPSYDPAPAPLSKTLREEILDRLIESVRTYPGDDA
jgi:hypothetical protein